MFRRMTFAVTLMAALAMILFNCPRFLAAEGAAAPSSGLPRLIDLGAKECIPCKLMAPILDGMKQELAGKLQVDFIDVNVKENLPLAKQYEIRLIPTQIFLDATGKEVWRHEGYISRYTILNKWRELKFEFAEKALAPTLVWWEPVKADGRAKGSVILRNASHSVAPRSMAASSRLESFRDKRRARMAPVV